MTQFNAGDTVGRHDLVTIHGKPVRLPDPEHLVHLQFRRYAGCPVCNLHMRDVAARHDDPGRRNPRGRRVLLRR